MFCALHDQGRADTSNRQGGKLRPIQATGPPSREGTPNTADLVRILACSRGTSLSRPPFSSTLFLITFRWCTPIQAVDIEGQARHSTRGSAERSWMQATSRLWSYVLAILYVLFTLSEVPFPWESAMVEEFTASPLTRASWAVKGPRVGQQLPQLCFWAQHECAWGRERERRDAGGRHGSTQTRSVAAAAAAAPCGRAQLCTSSAGMDVAWP